ncbi:MAG: hypothetical protein ACLPZR_23545, partial [Solirubrobacteraceae bacterium]
ESIRKWRLRQSIQESLHGEVLMRPVDAKGFNADIELKMPQGSPGGKILGRHNLLLGGFIGCHRTHSQ